MDATVTITVESDASQTHTETVQLHDVEHAIVRLGDGDGWKWATSHHGNRQRADIETAAGWALLCAWREAELAVDQGEEVGTNG